MDPCIVKLLEDDEDETMHSGVDVEAFQAALNIDIGGDVSTSQLWFIFSSGSEIDQLLSHIPSNASRIVSRTPPKKPAVGQKKPLEALGSSIPPSSIEQLNDIIAVSGVDLTNLMAALCYAVAKCGLKGMSNDVEKCLSLCVEERMRGLISNLTRISKQRVDFEKTRHRTVVTSDVRQQIMSINRKVREEWEKKQEKVDGLSKSTKVNKEEDDKMRTYAANVAARAAYGEMTCCQNGNLWLRKPRRNVMGGRTCHLWLQEKLGGIMPLHLCQVCDCSPGGNTRYLNLHSYIACTREFILMPQLNKFTLKLKSAVLACTTFNRDNMPAELDFSAVSMIALPVVCVVFGYIVYITLYSHFLNLEISAIKQKPPTGQAL
ncbi:hypothetical protein Fmac_032352 [Flemingia macrophylla]|uniref:Transcription initiation factor TFIID component TAF4 C-terminal domain-containing protein n=1 Tax=Flemingia macrophylla TaxID=520843 RepID=A0ABD1L4M8_9FABA